MLKFFTQKVGFIARCEKQKLFMRDTYLFSMLVSYLPITPHTSNLLLPNLHVKVPYNVMATLALTIPFVRDQKNTRGNPYTVVLFCLQSHGFSAKGAL